MIIKSAAIIIKDRSVLFLREKNFLYWITPGGKIEEGETPEEALNREIMEELSVKVKIIENLGIIKGKAFKGDDLVPIKMYLYKVNLLDQVRLDSEIIDQTYIKYCNIHNYLMTPIGLKIVKFLFDKGMID